MALAGSVIGPLAAVQLMAQYQAESEAAQAAMRYGDEALAVVPGHKLLLLVLVTGLLRAFSHRDAGIRLWRWVPSDPPIMRGVHRYVAAAALHTAACVMFVRARWDVAPIKLCAVAVITMAWPVAVVAILRLRRFRELPTPLPVPEDGGLDSVAVLVAVVSFIGLLVALVIDGALLQLDHLGLAPLLYAGAATLVAQWLHGVYTGVRALRGDPLASGP